MKRIVVMLAVVIALMVPAVAFGQESSTCQAYNPQLCESSSAGTTTTPQSDASSGTLPFTGLDVALLAAGGGSLLAAGFFVRRLSRRPN
jgi:hypothetical protein